MFLLIRYFLSKIPILYLILYNFNQKFFKSKEKKIFKKLFLNKNTDITIEGFPRSGNTFSYFAFNYFQKKKISIAHHVHHEYQLIYSYFHNLPNMILIRKPDDAVKSYLIRKEFSIEPKTAFREYYYYYLIAYNLKNKLLFFKFTSITNDIDKCIKIVNKKFQKNFDTNYLNIKDKKQIYKNIDKATSEKNFSYGNKINYKYIIKMTARPQSKRKLIKDTLRFKNFYWRKKANEIYKEIIKISN